MSSESDRGSLNKVRRSQKSEKIRKSLKGAFTVLPEGVQGKIMRRLVNIDDNECNDVIFKVATTDQEHVQLREILYQSYRGKGYIEENKSKSYSPPHLDEPSTLSFVGKINNQVVITMSLTCDSPAGLPIDELYKTEVNRFRETERCIAEVGSFASSQEVRTGRQLLPFMMNKIMFLHAESYFGVDDLLITVNPAHEAIYRHLLRFKRIGQNKAYSKVNGHIAVPLTLDLCQSEGWYRDIYGGQPGPKNLYDFFYVRKSHNILMSTADNKPGVYGGRLAG